MFYISLQRYSLEKSVYPWTTLVQGSEFFDQLPTFDPVLAFSLKTLSLTLTSIQLMCESHSVTPVETNFVTTLLRDISSWPDELRDKMHFVTSVCVNRYVDRHEHMSRSYTSKSRSYILSRTCADHEPICREHPTPPIWAVASAPGMKEHACSCSFAYVFVFYTFRSIRVRVLSSLTCSIVHFRWTSCRLSSNALQTRLRFLFPVSIIIPIST